MKIPKTKKSDGYTTIDAIVRLNDGITLRTAEQIKRECENYPKLIYFQKEENGGYAPEKYDCKRILDIASAAAFNKAKIRIFVEGENNEAKRFALRLHSALAGVDSYHLYFGRYNSIAYDKEAKGFRATL